VARGIRQVQPGAALWPAAQEITPEAEMRGSRKPQDSTRRRAPPLAHPNDGKRIRIWLTSA
jgi:hypothetical protein